MATNRRLRTACERAKRTLSSLTQASLEVDSLFEGIHLYTSVIRARFEELNSDLFTKTMKPVEKALQDANFSKSKIDEVVLVGGSKHIPKIRKLLQDFFNGKELCNSCIWCSYTSSCIGSGKNKKIAIKNNKGRLSKEEVEQMINEADKYKEEDDKPREKINAKNAFENYVFQMKNTINDVNLKGKVTEI